MEHMKYFYQENALPPMLRNIKQRTKILVNYPAIHGLNSLASFTIRDFIIIKHHLHVMNCKPIWQQHNVN